MLKKTIVTLLISIFPFLFGCKSQKISNSVGLKVMSFNIRNGHAKDGDNHWNLRKEIVGDVIKNYSPDILGLQEAFRFQLDFLNKQVLNYAEIGTGRDGGKRGEYSAILYKKDRFRATDSGTFWLSDTPGKPSKSWGNRYLRVCTWARLVEKKTDKAFYVYNTHLDHQSQNAREKSVQLIMKNIMQRERDEPFILTGDFNAGEDNNVITYLKGTKSMTNSVPQPLVDTFRVVHPKEHVVGTGNGGFKGAQNGPKIDYIFVLPRVRVLKAAINRAKFNDRYPSDHYPVTAEIKLYVNTAN